jgi:hypothetical protein
MNNLFPCRNFGASLFSSIAADSQKASLRRRALTEVDDLINNDMIGNEGRPLAD